MSNTPRWIAHRLAHALVRRAQIAEQLIAPPPLPRNLAGDRDVEWSWVASRIGTADGRVLDFGNGGSPLALLAAQRGYDVTALDYNPVAVPYEHPRLSFLQGDILQIELPAETFDLVINCSTVEHVGLAGRYNITAARPDGDLLAMQRLYVVLRPGGRMLLTIPVGADAVLGPMCRVYGPERLPRLLSGFRCLHEEYWAKNADNVWQQVTRESALSTSPMAAGPDSTHVLYSLGLFELER